MTIPEEPYFESAVGVPAPVAPNLPPPDMPLPAMAPPTMPPPEPAAAPAPPVEPATLSVACKSCGAQMHFRPGTTSLKCQACGVEQAIEATRQIEEHSFDSWSAIPEKRVATIGKQVLHCQGCGATTETDQLAGACQFCGGSLLAVTEPEGLIVPEAVLPFGIPKKGANEAFSKWVKSRWFAPNALKKVGSTEALKGTYIPHWTYDAQTQTDYTGQRGEHYYTTETRAVNGKTETYQQQHTRWYPASGHVSRGFDDVVVPASGVLAEDKLDKMGPWTMAQAQPFDPQYLAGYTALRYDVDPDSGLVTAKGKMESVINDDCRHDIGGDEQRVSSISVQYAALMFKLMMLPLWIASYVYAGKTYQVLINANTAEVVGDRPYSKVKIALAAIGALIVIGVGIAIYLSTKHSSSSNASLALLGIT